MGGAGVWLCGGGDDHGAGATGNPKPRIFRVPECAGLINRLGFNNDGCDAVEGRLQRLRESGRWPAIPVGINLGKSKIVPLQEATEDYLLSFERLKGLGDYFVLNVSSPNTPGLRQLQDRAALHELLGTIQGRNTAGVRCCSRSRRTSTGR